MAGEVVEIGADVQGIHVGDRVLGLALGGSPDVNSAAEGAFQSYVVLRDHLVCPIPDWISYEDACVVPLCGCTAAYGLFSETSLALERPTVPATSLEERGQALIITGGASSVGCNAIQFARSAGYHIYSTASPSNFEYVQRLGAVRVFDYHRPSLVNDILSALNADGLPLAGAFAIGNGSVETCVEVLSRYESRDPKKDKKFVAFAGFPVPPKMPTTYTGVAGFLGSTTWWMASRAVYSRFKGVQTKFIDVQNLSDPQNVVSRFIFKGMLPKALELGQIVPAPTPLVAGKGLKEIQDAFEVQQRGVSAKKVVVSL